MEDFRGPHPLSLWYWRREGLPHPGFIEDLGSQLADSSDGDRFAMLLMAIDRYKDIGDQAGKQLDHEAMTAP